MQIIGDLFVKYIKNSYNLIKRYVKHLKRCFSKEDIQMATRHIKRCLTSLVIREIKIDSSHFTPH